MVLTTSQTRSVLPFQAPADMVIRPLHQQDSPLKYDFEVPQGVALSPCLYSTDFSNVFCILPWSVNEIR